MIMKWNQIICGAFLELDAATCLAAAGVMSTCAGGSG